MKIAIPVLEDKGKESPISEHFGHAPYFAFITTESAGKYELDIVTNPLVNHQPGEVPGYLASNSVNMLIARGIGGRAIQFFEQMNIRVIRGASGTIEEIMAALFNNVLQDRDYEVKDKHHHHDH